MTARLAVTRAQARAIAEVAQEKGCVIEVEHDGVVYRVIPEGAARSWADRHQPAIELPREIEL